MAKMSPPYVPEPETPGLSEQDSNQTPQGLRQQGILRTTRHGHHWVVCRYTDSPQQLAAFESQTLALITRLSMSWERGAARRRKRLVARRGSGPYMLRADPTLPGVCL
jgi:hypothetical protein